VRVVLRYTDNYTPIAKAMLSDKLKVSWTATSADPSHASLRAGGGREYASNAFGIQRKDFTK
jgi:hypothetical protein